MPLHGHRANYHAGTDLHRQQAGQDVIQSPTIVKHIHQEQQDPDAFVLSVSQIEVKQQGRRTFENLDALAEDISSKGQLQPIVVKGCLFY